MRINLKNRLFLYILTPVLIIYFVIYILIFSNIINYSKDNIISNSNELTQKHSLIISGKLNSDLKVLNTFKKTIENFSFKEQNAQEQFLRDILKDILINNTDYSSVWYIRNDNVDETKFINEYYRSDDQLNYNKRTYNSEDMFFEKISSKLLGTQESIIFFTNDYKNSEKINQFVLVYAVPLYLNNKFTGFAGIKVEFEKLRKNFNNNLISSKSVRSYILSEELFLNLSENSNIDNEILREINERKFISNSKIVKQNSFFWKYRRDDYIVNYIPVNITDATGKLSLLSVIPNREMYSFISNFYLTYFFYAGLGFFVILLMTYLFYRYWHSKIKEPLTVIIAMATGRVNEIKKLPEYRADVFGDLNKSINQINSSLDKTAEFIEEIGKGNFDYSYSPVFKEDRIGNSLVELKRSIELAEIEDKKRKEADERLNWATRGSAKFSEIIREHSDNPEELAYAIISELVNYIDANQGGLFVINEDDENQKYVELLASFAYDRKKMLEKRIPYGVGLVGRCIQERETIYITKVPKHYLNITSGLGDEIPGTLLIIPLIFHEEVFGVVELASFKNIEEYKINLVEQIAEGIASAISMVKINARTAGLLKETKIKSEQSASQEEEIRQNIEEMQASTDELNNKLDSLTGTFEAVKSVANIAEFDTKGRIIDISPNFLKLLKKEKKDIIGKFQGSFSTEALNTESFNNFWRELRAGKKMEFQQIINVEEKLVNISSVYIPLKNTEGKVYKVVSLADVK